MKFKSPIYFVVAGFSVGFYVIYKFVEAFEEHGIGGILAVFLIFFVGLHIVETFIKK